MALQVTSTSINPNHLKRSTYMRSRNPVVLRLMLAAVVLVACSCAVLAPGADRVKFTQNAADVAGCKVVGNVSGLFRVGDHSSTPRISCAIEPSASTGTLSFSPRKGRAWLTV